MEEPASLVLLAPLQGWATPLREVPDPVFSGRIMGDGVAIDPTAGELRAPCDGVIVQAAAHAVTLRADNGADILMHVGLETVALGGKGFVAQARLDQRVRMGDPLLAFDLEFLGDHAASLLTPIVIANGEAFEIIHRTENREVAAGDVLLEIRARPAVQQAVISTGPEIREAVVGALHGLHARPSALVAAKARSFPGEISLALHGRRANAKSVAALMALGARRNDLVRIEAEGANAPAVLAALADIIAARTNDDVPGKLAPLSAPKTAREVEPGVLRGVCAAPGLALGQAVHIDAMDITPSEQGAGIAAETAALDGALAALRIELAQAGQAGTQAQREIMAAHAVLLDDPDLYAASLRSIESDKSAGFAWRQALRGFAGMLAQTADAHMRERADDFHDLERRVLRRLAGKEAARILPPRAILLAKEFLPSDLTTLNLASVHGIASNSGGPTSHVAILAAGMNLPALVGMGPALDGIADGTPLLLDADAGLLTPNPDPAQMARAEQIIAAQATQCENEVAKECRTADGHRVILLANLGDGAADAAAAALRSGAEGCGLLRTEFLFMDRSSPPSESEQVSIYQGIADALEGKPLTLRLFDVGGDKPVPYLHQAGESNPALGLRGIRALLAHLDLLEIQLRAALQVRPAGQVHILLPMITSLNEIRAVRAMADSLGTGTVSLGVMIETPAAALIADQLARHADFFSIGTNDLTQYVLAMDRTNAQLAGRIDALEPAVLRLIDQVARAGRAAGKPVAVCGGLAADPLAAPLLVGLGIDELSMPAGRIPALKAKIGAMTLEQCRAAARIVLELDSASAVREFLQASGDRQ